MNSDYVLVCRWGVAAKVTHSISAATEEKAEEAARKIVSEQQMENVKEFPFAPEIVTATLYPGFKEFRGKIRPVPRSRYGNLTTEIDLSP